MKVLIVDDDPLVAKSLTRMLRGHDVIVAHSAEESLGSLEGIDFVICDLHLPEMSGAALHAAASRRHPSLAQRFLFITGGSSAPEDEAFLAGKQVLLKPFSKSQLLERLPQE